MIRNDSWGLINTFGLIANNQTGIGTSRSKSEATSLNLSSLRLTRQELELLVQDGMLRTVVELYPRSAAKSWFSLSIADNKQGDNLANELMQYLEDLGDRSDATDSEQASEIYGVREAFFLASSLARQFGKAYVLVGVDDGQELDKSIDKEAIASVRWLQVYDNSQVVPITDDAVNRLPQVYELIYKNKYTEERIKVHRSRLLPFWGNRILHGTGRQDGVSVLQLVFDAYCDWLQGIKAGSAMLADYDVFTLGMKGLGQVMLSDRQTNSTAGSDAVIARATALDMGKSVVRGIIYDLENEQPGSVTRSYAGASEIVQPLEARWVAVSRIPRFKLFGEIGSQGLSNNQGLAMRAEWALLVQDFAQTWEPNLRSLLKLAFLAQDTPSKDIPKFQLTANYDLQLTLQEKMELEKSAADRSKVLVDMGVVKPEEVRTGYEGSTFNPDITLSVSGDKGVTRQDGKDVLTDKEWEAIANISAADWVQVASEVLDVE